MGDFFFFPWRDMFLERLIICSTPDLFATIGVKLHCRFSSVCENDMARKYSGSSLPPPPPHISPTSTAERLWTNPHLHFSTTDLVAFSPARRLRRRRHLTAVRSGTQMPELLVACVRARATRTYLHNEGGRRDSLSARSTLASLTFADCSARLTITAGQSQLPVVCLLSCKQDHLNNYSVNCWCRAHRSPQARSYTREAEKLPSLSRH